MSYEDIELRFKSGNDIPVERATVLGAERDAVKEEIAGLKERVSEEYNKHEDALCKIEDLEAQLLAKDAKYDCMYITCQGFEDQLDIEMKAHQALIKNSIPKERVEALIEKLKMTQNHNRLSYNFSTSEGIKISIMEVENLFTNQPDNDYNLTESCGFNTDLSFTKVKSDV